MPLNRSPRSVAAANNTSKRSRPINPRCRAGASSMLRLTQATSQRLPSSAALGTWVSHAASVLLPVTGPLAASWEA